MGILVDFEVFEKIEPGYKSLQRPGIEPGPPAWQARILPLNQRCLSNWSLSSDYNRTFKIAYHA